MDLRQLEAFVYVTEEKSFSKAAELLFLTQPTISTHIQLLEKELNTQLIVRTAKDIHPSEDGKKLYTYAREMLNLRNRVLEEFNQEPFGHSSDIRLAASTVPAQYILPEVLPAFRTVYPKSSFYMLQDDSHGVIEKILAHSVEFGLVGTAEDKQNCYYEPFFEDALVIVTPNTPKYQKMKAENCPLETLLKEPIILREAGSGTKKEAERFLAKIKFDSADLNIVAQMNDQEAIKKAVSNGLGISIMSKKAVQDFEGFGQVLIFDLGEQTLYRKLYVAYSKNKRLSMGAQRFIKYIKKFYCDSNGK
ncbi:MAG: selenium metabolism-associated LysR family transcriptional regulator [Cellulosilyticaceae bacterium]